MGRKAFQGVVIIVAMMFFLSFATFTEAVAGGEEAKPGEFPHAVQLSFYTGDHFCGGSIIAPSVIVTAAHCLKIVLEPPIRNMTEIELPPCSIEVTGGEIWSRESRFFQDKKGQIRDVDRYVLHPEFNPVSQKNDIALLFLEKPLIFNEKVQPVQLPPPNVFFPRGTVAGWGWTDWRNVTSPYLKKIEVVFEDIALSVFGPFMGTESLNFQLFELSYKGNGSCMGDSGSSVICPRSTAAKFQNDIGKMSAQPPTICGIVSGGTGELCGEPRVNLFADVSQYVEWIQDTVFTEGFRGLTKPLTCSESEGFFDCGEFFLDGERIKTRCILIEKKCDGINNCGNGRDENVCDSIPVWVCVTFTTLILIGVIIATGYWLWNRYRSQNQDLDSSKV